VSAPDPSTKAAADSAAKSAPPRPSEAHIPSCIVTPADLRAILRSGAELALIDVREEGAFLERHLLHARNMPLGRLAAEIGTLAPRRRVLVVTMDSGTDEQGAPEALEAARLLTRLGYTNVLTLEGGLAGWRAAGGEAFSGSHVPSKAFGEFVERTYRTPHILAEELARLIEAGANVTVLDARTFDEYHDMSIPTAVNVPGEDLVRRVHDLAPAPNTLVVVNCAGRTRSIIGAQALINAGIPNRVAALKDGTSGWQLASLSLAHGARNGPPELGARALDAARKRVAEVARRFGVRTLSARDLQRWRAETEIRTLYLIDVRSPAEYRAGHLSGVRNVPGGQLVQATDRHLGVMGARVALIDDDGVRATMSASWLIQMGWADVAVVQGGLEGAMDALPDSSLVSATPGTATSAEIAALAPASLASLMRSSLASVVLDVSDPAAFARGHVPGAYGVGGAPSRTIWRAVANIDAVVFTGSSEAEARAAAQSLAAVSATAPVNVLAGGTPAWIGAGLPVEAGAGRTLALGGAASPTDPAALEHQLRKYLAWEVGLMDQIRRSGEAPFRYFAP